MNQRKMVIATSGVCRVAAVAAQVGILMMAYGCESRSPTATLPVHETPTPTAPVATGTIGGTVTINGEARPIVWVELQLQAGGWPWAYGTTNSDGSWEWARVPVGKFVVVIKTPPELACDATRKSAIVEMDQSKVVVNFACVGDVKASIQGFTSHEFGTNPFARVTLTGPINGETMSDENGFFAFKDLPPGEYSVGRCNPVRVTVREGATAFARDDCS